MKRTTQKFRLTLTAWSVAAFAAFGAVGCGPQAFVVTNSNQNQAAPGVFTVPTKVDILFVEDDTGSMYEPFKKINAQVPGFLANLESKGWDYRFAVMPLTTVREIQDVMASKYDPNWDDEWKMPYPGAPRDAVDRLDVSLFNPSNAGFLNPGDFKLGANSEEPGLQTIRDTLNLASTKSKFLRKDAILVIVVVGNGQDTSGVTLCKRPSDNILVPCESEGKPGTAESSLIGFQGDFTALKDSSSMVRFFAAVAPENYSSMSCLGGNATMGSRYRWMADKFGGDDFKSNICAPDATNKLFASLESALGSSQLTLRKRILFIDREPDLATVKVTKYMDGDKTRGVEIPMDEFDGWTYLGQVNNVYTIDLPVNMTLGSGIAIELHGSARLMGADTAAVEFKPAGAKESAK